MTKNIFKENYVGPEGPHLNCLTQTTVSGGYQEDKQISIHPTGRHTRLHRRRDNDGPIAGARNPSRKGHLAKASKTLDIRRRDREATMSGGKTSIPDGAYTAPGSMQW